MEILAINPTKKKATKKRAATEPKGSKIMATTKKKKTTKKPVTNPSVAKRAKARAKATFLGMNFGSAFRNTIPMIAGALAMQWGAKKFSDSGNANDPNWEAKNYAIGGACAVGAGLIAENIKRGSGQKVLEGGLVLLAYKLFVNELAPKVDFLEEQFGADDYQPGDGYLDGAGETFVMGADHQWYPSGGGVSSNNDRMLGAYDEDDYAVNGTLAPPSNLGATLAPPSGLGDDPSYDYAFHGQDGGASDPYAAMYHRG